MSCRYTIPDRTPLFLVLSTYLVLRPFPCPHDPSLPGSTRDPSTQSVAPPTNSGLFSPIPSLYACRPTPPRRSRCPSHLTTPVSSSPLRSFLSPDPPTLSEWDGKRKNEVRPGPSSRRGRTKRLHWTVSRTLCLVRSDPQERNRGP